MVNKLKVCSGGPIRTDFEQPFGQLQRLNEDDVTEHGGPAARVGTRRPPCTMTPSCGRFSRATPVRKRSTPPSQPGRLPRLGTVGCGSRIGIGDGTPADEPGRVLQSETTVFADRLSWLPYLIVAVLMLAVIGLALFGISRSAQRRTSGESR